MTTIDTTHIDYDRHAKVWKEVNDLCEGENLREYLAEIDAVGSPEEKEARRKAYYDRAVFYEVSGRTSIGMLGMMFRRSPAFEPPSGLQYVTENMDGTGINIYQQSQDAALKLIRVGRCGLWVDYPPTNGGASKADLDEMRVFSTTKLFSAENIADWDLTTKGAKVYLSRVLIRDEISVNGKMIDARLELILDNYAHNNDGEYVRMFDSPVYQVREWRKGESGWDLHSEFAPTDGSGSYWEEIPFMFLGSINNSHHIDKPPMRGITRIEKGVWNNSAANEDNNHYTCIIQPWMSGIEPDDERLRSIVLGSGYMIGVPAGEQFGFAQADPNKTISEEIDKKIDRMVGLGAMFLQPGSVAKTATQSGGEQEVQHSVLSLISANVSEGYTQALKWMARYMNADENKCEYSVSQEFVRPNATPQELQAVVMAMMQGGLPWSDYWRWMQRNGYADREKTAEKAAEEVQPVNVPDLGQAA